jgi:hypothetical protein
MKHYYINNVPVGAIYSGYTSAIFINRT